MEIPFGGRSAEISKHAGVIGHPIAHSRSPLIHNHWLQKYNIAGDYQAYDVAPGKLNEVILKLRDAGLSGFNVTIPHKQAILDICTTLTKDARAIGAVNTVVFYPNGQVEGRNTDAYGFTENLKQSVPGLDFKSRPAVVLGAGGAARAVIYALMQEGVPEIRLANRTVDKAEILAEEFGCRVFDWDDKELALGGAGLLVNTTSLGMQGQAQLEIDLSNLPEDAIVNDIVYTPLMTPLLQQAQARGLQVVTGIGMLLHQARPAFQAWFGILPEVDSRLKAKILA